ncbi:MAG: family 10 glycosylhydrolase [Candidatus Neomarinimicrobiota bacterium]
MKNKIIAVLLSIFMLSALFAQNMPPKREFRGVWLSTVANIDWPKNKADSDVKKQNDLKNYLLKLKDAGVNSVLMQVRCSCDAMYKSDIEPWSYWFSGKQGKAPSVDWDPLEFAIEEAHKLGMELHAWVNPYRALVSPSSSVSSTSAYISDSHVTKTHPDWILKFSDVWIIDPGLPQVRDYITDVLMDIVNRYDIDGLHMDDYFYPYSGITNEDSETFILDPRGFTDVHDWRRDNINLLVQTLNDSIDAVKPWVKWGVSPFGIWKPGVPSGISGMNAYNVLYCDPIAWLENKTVDYITPQCYWPFGGGQDYAKLVPWWAEQAGKNERHFYPGQGLYRAGSWDIGEIPRQVKLNRATEYCDGSVFFTANDFYKNSKNSIDSLKYDLYSSPSLWPVMSWHDTVAPAMPKSIQLAIEGDGSKTLSWDAPGYTEPEDSAYAYLVYRSPHPVDREDMRAAQTILINKENEFTDNSSGSYYYAVSTLDRYKNESDVHQADVPFVDLLSPAFASADIPADTLLKWAGKNGADQYLLELAYNADFTAPIIQKSIADTQQAVSLSYNAKYFWRVKANNIDHWSPIWTFSTQDEPQVEPLSPADNYQAASIDPVLIWRSFQDASSYDVQVSLNSSMSDLLVNVNTFTDTSYQVHDLAPTRQYYWRVRSNKYSRWSEVQSFRTKEIHIETLWQHSRIAGNYPDFFEDHLESAAIATGNYFGNEIVIFLQSHGDSVKTGALSVTDGQSLNFTLNLEGVEGGSHMLRDIEFSEDGVIYASNCVDKSGTFKLYQWLNPLEAPEMIFQLENVSYRLGDHISVRGKHNDKSVEIYAPGAKTNEMLKITWQATNSRFEETVISFDKNNYKNPSVAFVPGTGSYYVKSTGYYMRHFSEDGRFVDWMQGNADLPIKVSSIETFAYGDKHFVVGYDTDTESAYIIDASEGLSNAKFAGATYSLGSHTNKNALGDVEIIRREDGKFDIFVIGDQNGIAAYRYDARIIPTDIVKFDQPGDFELKANYPNPFNPTTTIPYSMKQDAHVSIDIFDISGKYIQTLYHGHQKAGLHQVYFNAFDFGSGIYICKMKVGNEVLARKLTLIK